MIKNIGKLKQWTGEKLGSAKSTLQTEDFHRLEVETERKRIAYEKLHASSLILNIQLAKRKVSPEDNKSKRLPNDLYGVCLSNFGNELMDDSPLGMVSVQFGQAQSKIATYQEEMADMMKSSYMEKLDYGLQQYKEYQQLRKKLESRRLDYDAKLSRLQKSKKEKPELEQEMQMAKMKYEDSEYDCIQKMVALQDFEDNHCEALQQFIELQLDFFSRSLDALNDAKSNWAQTNTNRPRRNPTLSRTSSNHSSDDMNNISMIKSTSTTSNRGLSIQRNGSTDTSMNHSTRRMPSRKNSAYSDREDIPIPSSRTAPPPPPPTLPRRQSQANTETRNQRKAVYDFNGNNTDELSFKVGDIIQVVEEVDEGWWIGEIIENGYQTRKGIFPVNYTEAISHQSAGPPMPARPNLSTTTQSYSIQEEQDDSPFDDVNRTAHNNNSRGFSYIKPNNSTPSTPVPQTYKSKRAPPPPPASRTPPVMMNSRSPSTVSNGIRTAPTTPYQQRSQDSYFESNNNSHSSCLECDCNDFSANIFKKGHCNNCFHKHF